LTPASAPVWALVSGLPGGKRERWVMGPFQAFIDDSGSDPKSAIFVMAGFIARAEQWAAFSNEWQEALDKPPKLDYFKMTEAASLGRHGQFARHKGWNEAKRDNRLADLTRIIRKHAVMRISASIKHSHFEKYVQSIPAPMRRLAADTPYTILFMQVILTTAIFADRLGVAEPCDFIFDRQLGFDDEALAWWPNFKWMIDNQARSDIKKFIGSAPVFRDEKDFLPLQAADLYAWQVRQNYTQNKTLWMPPSRILRQLDPIPGVHRNMNEKELERLNKHLLKIGAQYAATYPDIKLVHVSKNRRERKKAHRLARKATNAKASPSSSKGQPS
jgi:hypothetical protein